MKVKKIIFAIPAAATAMPAKPKMAAMNATKKNPNAHFNISPPPKPFCHFLGQRFTGHGGCGSGGISCNLRSVPQKIAYVVMFLYDVSHCDM
jgi:hypothetical protein